MGFQPSRLATINVPIVGANNPALLTRAPKGKVVRILVRNVGGVLVFLTHEANDLATLANASSAAYRLPPAHADVFVLMPEQSLFAAGQGAQAFVSIAISEAIPEQKFES